MSNVDILHPSQSTAKWSGTMPIPQRGELVLGRMNSLGIAKVVGYFEDSGYLGVLVIPLNPPEHIVRRVGYNQPVGLFGAELGAMTDKSLDPVPSVEQLEALQAFANSHEKWKEALCAVWARGDDDRMPRGHLLRQVRNQFGPDWLMSSANPVVPYTGGKTLPIPRFSAEEARYRAASAPVFVFGTPELDAVHDQRDDRGRYTAYFEYVVTAPGVLGGQGYRTFNILRPGQHVPESYDI